MAFEKNDPVYYQGRPYTVIRPDSATSVEIYPGDTPDGLRNADRGNWVSENQLTLRDRTAASAEELALHELWKFMKADDWQGALAALAAYGNKRVKQGNGRS